MLERIAWLSLQPCCHPRMYTASSLGSTPNYKRAGMPCHGPTHSSTQDLPKPHISHDPPRTYQNLISVMTHEHTTSPPSHHATRVVTTSFRLLWSTVKYHHSKKLLVPSCSWPYPARVPHSFVSYSYPHLTLVCHFMHCLTLTQVLLVYVVLGGHAAPSRTTATTLQPPS